MQNTCTLTYRLCGIVWYRSSLWSPTRCTISEPDPNSAPACGVSGAQMFPAGLKRRVSQPAVITCSSAQRPIFAYFWTYWMKAPFCLQANRLEYLQYLCGILSIQAIRFCSNVSFYLSIFKQLSAHDCGLCVESKTIHQWWDRVHRGLHWDSNKMSNCSWVLLYIG